MKLKYYLRGLGVGIVLTAVIMGVVLGRKGSDISDEEVIRRAKQLGMVEAESTLSSYNDSAKSAEVIDEANESSSDKKVDQAGEEISKEVNEGEPLAGEPVPEVEEEAKEDSTTGESSESITSEEDVKLSSNDATQTPSTDVVEAEKTPEGKGEGTEEAKEDIKVEPSENTVSTSLENNDNSGNTQAKQTDTNEDNNNAAAANENTKPEESAPADNSTDVNYIVVVLPSGSESDTCARILRESGVIDDGVAFNKYLVSSGLDRKIRSGTKQIPKGATFEEIAAVITR